MIFLDECLNPLFGPIFESNLYPPQVVIKAVEIGLGTSDASVVKRIKAISGAERVIIGTQDLCFFRDAALASERDWCGIVEIEDLHPCFRSALISTIESLLANYRFDDLIGRRIRVKYWRYYEEAWC